MRDFLAKIDWIAEVGFTGAPRDEILPGMRAFPFRGRCIYYRHDSESVLILRILHGAQDVTAQTFDPE